MTLHPALFLDRDGVIIENRANYVRSWSDVEIYPQALTALANIRELGYKIIIVTNQSGIGRGLIPYATAAAVNNKLVKIITQAGGRVDAVFMCPHTPSDQCQCRKPKPGLLLQAAKQHSLDLSRSFMIGDALTDIAAGQTAGVARAILLRTGRGAAQAMLPEASNFAPLCIHDTLTSALTAIARNNQAR